MSGADPRHEPPPQKSARPGWAGPLLELADRLEGQEARWPSVLARLVVSRDAPENGPWPILFAYFELAADYGSATYTVAMRKPNRIVHPRIPLGTFLELLRSWARDEAATVGHWTLLAPAGVHNLTWHGPWTDLSGAVAIRLLGPFPTSIAPTPIRRLTGSGDQLNYEYNTLVDAMRTVSRSQQEWIETYSHPAIGNQMNTFLVVEEPDPLAIEAECDHETLDLQVTLRYRWPDEPSSFEVRVGPEPWDPNRTPLGYDSNEPLAKGWWVIRYHTRLDSPGDNSIWVSKRDAEAEFGWRASLRAGDPDPARTKLTALIHTWFGLTHARAARTFAAGLQPRSVNPSRGTPSSSGLEVSLHAACLGLGWPTLFGGETLKTPGVDLIAADREAHTLLAISATTETDIPKKLDSWWKVSEEIITAVAPEWTVRPIIITSRSKGDCNQADIKEAYLRGVLVLTSEDLECLLQDPGAPDYATFRSKLYLQLIGRTGRSKFVAAPEVLEQMRVVDLD